MVKVGELSDARNDRVNLSLNQRGLNMQQFIPLELFGYFLVFQGHFSKPNFIYFQGYLWGLLLARGRKTMNNIAHCCFWVERSLSSWERFLSENLWDVNAVGKTLVTLLLQKLESQLQIHGGYLAALDTLFLKMDKKCQEFNFGRTTVGMRIEEKDSRVIIGAFSD